MVRGTRRVLREEICSSVADPVRLTLSIQDPALRWERRRCPQQKVPVLILEPGQIVNGRVEVEVLEDVEFREAQVRFLWHTEGKGNRVTGERGTETLARGGKWYRRHKPRILLRLAAPWGPLTYEGKILKVLWALEARLDRSLLKSDVVESIPVRLEGTPDPELASLGPVPQEKEKLEAVKKGRVGTWVAVGSLFILMGAPLWGRQRLGSPDAWEG